MSFFRFLAFECTIIKICHLGEAKLVGRADVQIRFGRKGQRKAANAICRKWTQQCRLLIGATDKKKRNALTEIARTGHRRQRSAKPMSGLNPDAMNKERTSLLGWGSRLEFGLGGIAPRAELMMLNRSSLTDTILLLFRFLVFRREVYFGNHEYHKISG